MNNKILLTSFSALLSVLLLRVSLLSVSLLSASVLLSSCATMSKDECMNADWHIKGLADASQGYPLNRIAEHSKACARVKVTPVMKDYENGHKKGARLYCVPEKGYSAGRDGAAYHGICPQELESQFLRAYRDGQEIFSIQRSINKLANEMASNQARIDSNHNEIHALQYDIAERNNTSSERQYKLQRIDRLYYDITDLEVRNDHAAYEWNLFKNDFRVVEDKHFRLGYIQ